jgi:predicted nucleic acid-binding protein
MVIVDTSLWVTYLREGNHHLEELLLNGEVLCHPFIVGELACGNIKNRTEFLTLLHSLVMAPTVALHKLLYFIEKNTLMGKGIGFVDAHLLASAKLTEAPLWTSDKKLKSAAIDLKVAYKIGDVTP